MGFHQQKYTTTGKFVTVDDDSGAGPVHPQLTKMYNWCMYVLESNFGPPPAVAREVNGTRKQSKTRRKREEKHKIAAEKRRLAQELENSEDERAATDRRRRERLERKEAEREAKREKREVTAVMNGGTLSRTR